MKHYATWVDLFEILNGEFKKEMVGGRGYMPLLCGQCSRPLGQGKYDTWLANAIQFVIACYLHI